MTTWTRPGRNARLGASSSEPGPPAWPDRPPPRPYTAEDFSEDEWQAIAELTVQQSVFLRELREQYRRRRKEQP